MAYNLLDLRSRVRTKIGDTAYSASTIDGYINDTITEIADLFPWIFLQKLDTSGVLTIGSNTYTQPSDHQTTTKLVLVHPTTATTHWDITKNYIPWEQFFSMYPAPDTLNDSQPMYWTEYGNLMYFNCPADLAYKVRQYYQSVPTELSNDSDVPVLPINFRETIVLGASYRCEEERENYDIAMMIQNRFTGRVAELITRYSNDTMTGPDTVVRPTSRPLDPWNDK